MWTHWIYVQMPGQDLEYYQIEPEPKHPPERGQAYVQRLQSLIRVLKTLGIL